MSSRHYTPESVALARICNEWYISFGAIALVVVISLWVSPFWMPLFEVAFAMAIALAGPARRNNKSYSCGQLSTVAIYALISTSLVSFLINMAYKTSFIHYLFEIDTLNHSIPYITSLVIFPICAIISGVYVLPISYRRHTHNCPLHNDYNPGHPMLGRMVHATYNSLLRKAAIISAIISLIDWGYYFLCYNNKSLNSPDRFFFFIIPAAIYVWSVFYVRKSYSTLALSNGRVIHASTFQAPLNNSLKDSVIVRLTVVKGDDMLLDVNQQNLSNCAVDTPFIIIKPALYAIDVDSVKKEFEHLTGMSSNNFKVRYLFKDDNSFNNNKTYNYLITFNDDDLQDNSVFSGQWCSLGEVETMLKMGVLSPQLSHEIYLLYTITMAWKGYDKRGKRKYPIKNYKPTFRLGQMHEWDVDYDDTDWIKIYQLNQDSKFWRLRKLFK